MTKPFKSLIRRTLLSGKQNLTSLDEPYEVIARLLTGKSIDNMLDAGASHGRVAERLARPFPKANVHMFEPNPDYVGDLQTLHNRDNRFRHWPMALADQEGEMELHFTESRGTTSLFKPNTRADDTWGQQLHVKESRAVPVVTIDGWAERENIGPIGFMKFDIQAGELLALRGAEKTLRDQALLVYTEIFFNPMYDGGALFGDIDALLRSHGFLLYNIYKPAADSRGMLLHANPIYVHSERLGF